MAITQNTYTGDGSTVLFSFTFEYLTESDIKITLNGTPTTAYTLATATSIQFNTAPAIGVTIRIYRDTDIDTLSATFFPGSAIKAEDLNSNYTQNNYAAQEAKRESDAAVSAADNALSIVNSVVSYDPVANVAAIPAAPSDGDRIEVLDSTGIESFTPLTGVPAGGFTGASTLSVRIVYSITTWVWQDYQSRDPDSRYLKVNGDSTMTGNLVMGTNKITGLVNPTSAQEAATKNYVDTQDNTKLSLSGGTMTGNLVMGTNGITGLVDPTSAQDAATKYYVDIQDATKLSLSGGTMTGNIAMNTNSITGLVDPTSAQEAATKNYVDTQDATKLSLSGGTMSGNINMGTNKINNLGNPIFSTDAATKNYVDGNSINNVVEDVTPQLGGNLDVNGNTITSTSNGNIVISPDGTGTVDVNSSRITSVTDPSGNQDAATKKYVDDADNLKLNLSGGTMSGDITFNASTVKATNLQNPSASSPSLTLATDGAYRLFNGFNRRPPFHRGPLFYKTASLTISIVADCALNGFYYSTATAVTMPGSFSNNVDYAIWQDPDTGDLEADLSFTTAPMTGGKIVGGFHHIPSGRPTAVNSGSPTAAAEILEYSIWDLTWRPACPDPRGMTCVDERLWCDLYFCGSTSYAGSDFSAVPSSKIGLTIADGNDPPLIPAFYGGDGSTNYANDSTLVKGCWYDFCEVASSFGKRLLTISEFQVAAFGAPEAGSRGTDPGTVIWERVSKWGLAQATGTLHSFGANLLFRDENNQTFAWRTGVTRSRGHVYQQGNASSIAAVYLGGSWPDTSSSGSRASAWNGPPWNAYNGVSARFAAEHFVTC